VPNENPAPQVSWEEVEREARSLHDEATSAGLTLRLVGSTGVRMHCSAAASAMERSNRGPKDIDWIGRSRERKELRTLLENRGYELDRDVLVAMEGQRFCLAHPDSGIELDVFFDDLEFCHTIKLGDRLTLESPSIPIEDLLLQKLQVRELTETDAIDAAVILAVHDLGQSSTGCGGIDSEYIVFLLSKDWGFYRTATENLSRIRNMKASGRLAGLSAAESDRLSSGIDELNGTIESSSKSRAWRIRARIGDRMQWWDDVDEREPTY
jgi:hypothetical protein